VYPSSRPSAGTGRLEPRGRPPGIAGGAQRPAPEPQPPPAPARRPLPVPTDARSHGRRSAPRTSPGKPRLGDSSLLSPPTGRAPHRQRAAAPRQQPQRRIQRVHRPARTADTPAAGGHTPLDPAASSTPAAPDHFALTRPRTPDTERQRARPPRRGPGLGAAPPEDPRALLKELGFYLVDIDLLQRWGDGERMQISFTGLTSRGGVVALNPYGEPCCFLLSQTLRCTWPPQPRLRPFLHSQTCPPGSQGAGAM